MKKLLIAVLAGVFMTACSEAPTAPSAPRTAAPNVVHHDLDCRSGYVIAYDEYGNPYCAPSDGVQPAATGMIIAAPIDTTQP